MSVRILIGDCRDLLKTLPDESAHCVVTSPPYFGLRDYGVAGQIGLEPTPDAFVAEMVDVFAEVRRVLRDDGTLWLNLGDSYTTQGGKNTTPHTGAMFADRSRGKDVIYRSKRLDRGAGRWGGENIGAGAARLKPKDLIGAPWRVAFALQSDGWYLRQDIIWSKPTPMPESVRDRCTKSHEYIFLLSKSARYHYDADAIREPLAAKTFSTFGTTHRPQGNDAMGNNKSDNWGSSVAIRQPKLTDGGEIAGANKRSVWTVSTKAFPDAHFATFPPSLIEPCIKAGCPTGGTVLDPFGGSGTTGLVADRLGRNAILIELNPQYAEMARMRIASDGGLLTDVEIERPAFTAPQKTAEVSA